MRENLLAFKKQLVLFFFGACSYGLMELVWRGYTHWSMFIAGGICFTILGMLNQTLSKHVNFWVLSVMGALIITTVEFVFGAIFNLWLNLGIWNYSQVPFNIYGQVCLPFTALWVIISALALFMDRFLRFKMFGDVYEKRQKPIREIKAREDA